mmetsp:Transcript_25284/g.57441  ORF Transcript_25284/g.57441 Transcript_25284/m.57441 type:complete len:372 (-) Transcript_25284:755-1870(-)
MNYIGSPTSGEAVVASGSPCACGVSTSGVSASGADTSGVSDFGVSASCFRGGLLGTERPCCPTSLAYSCSRSGMTTTSLSLLASRSGSCPSPLHIFANVFDWCSSFCFRRRFASLSSSLPSLLLGSTSRSLCRSAMASEYSLRAICALARLKSALGLAVSSFNTDVHNSLTVFMLPILSIHMALLSWATRLSSAASGWSSTLKKSRAMKSSAINSYRWHASLIRPRLYSSVATSLRARPRSILPALSRSHFSSTFSKLTTATCIMIGGSRSSGSPRSPPETAAEEEHLRIASSPSFMSITEPSSASQTSPLPAVKENSRASLRTFSPPAVALMTRTFTFAVSCSLSVPSPSLILFLSTVLSRSPTLMSCTS